MLTTALAVLAGTLSAAPVASAAGNSPAFVQYQLVAKHSGKCMNLPNGDTSDGVRITQFQCGNWNDHYWYVEPHLGAFRIRNVASGKCLALPGGSTTPGEQLIQWPCGDWADHHWRFVRYSDGRYQIININSGQCIGVRAGNAADFAAVIQWPCGDWADHFWAFSNPR